MSDFVEGGDGVVVVLAPLFPPAFLGGGPIRTLEALVRGAPDSFSTSVITSSRDLGQASHLDIPVGSWVDLGPQARVRYVDVRSLRALWDAYGELRRLRPDVVYLNGFFSAWSTVFPQLLMRSRLLPRARLVLAPRGEFGDAAVAIKGLKKRVFLGLYRRLGFAQRVLWHASSLDEAADISRVIGPSAAIVIREDDVDLPMSPMPPEPRADPILRAVHVARLSPIKGLDVLLEGLRGVTAELILDVFGPEEDAGYVARCRRLVDSLPGNITVAFHGSIPHEAVRELVEGYDVMLFPTHGENFGHIVAESLSVSCPVVAADTTPWTPVLADGGGIVVSSNTAEVWADAVQTYAARGSDYWLANRHRAGAAYKQWRLRSSQQPHVFSLVAGRIEPF